MSAHTPIQKSALSVEETTPSRSASKILVLALLATAALCFGKAGYIHVKAITAQWLMANAWAKTLTSQQLGHRPWPWLDTWPVAKMDIPRLDIQLLVLDGLQGQALAFGPGSQLWPAWESPPLGDSGFQVIAGHNDTHFDFLADLQTGEIVRLQNQFGGWRSYRVQQLQLVSANEGSVALYSDDLQTDDIFLMTCASALQALIPNQRRLIAHLKPVLHKVS